MIRDDVLFGILCILFTQDFGGVSEHEKCMYILNIDHYNTRLCAWKDRVVYIDHYQLTEDTTNTPRCTWRKKNYMLPSSSPT